MMTLRCLRVIGRVTACGALMLLTIACGRAETTTSTLAASTRPDVGTADSQPRVSATSQSFAAPSAQAPIEPNDEEGYVGQILKRQFGETPRMGWLLPGAGFVTAENHDAVTVLAGTGSPPRVASVGVATPAQRSAMKEQFLACETPAVDPLFLFADIVPRPDFPRALFVASPLPIPVRGGMEPVALTAGDLSEVDRALGWQGVAGPRIDRAYGAGYPFFYSIHRRYDAASRELHREALVLHDAAHRIVAFDKSDDLEKDLCDGCGLPALADDVGFLYRPLNLFAMPGFRFPLLLLDTSTIEGRALSLTTFRPDGRVASFRQYEYAFTCGLDAGTGK